MLPEPLSESAVARLRARPPVARAEHLGRRAVRKALRRVVLAGGAELVAATRHSAAQVQDVREQVDRLQDRAGGTVDATGLAAEVLVLRAEVRALTARLTALEQDRPA